MLGHAEYICLQDFVSANPGLRSVVTNVPRFSTDEIVYGVCLSQNSRRRIVRAEQKSVMFMKNFARKVLKPFQVLLDALSRMLSTLMVCLLLENHSLFIVYCKVIDCV